MDTSRQVGTAFRDFANTKLQQFLNEVRDVNFVMLCSSDGFELSLASKKAMDNTGKIAAVSSSILAMISAFISEIQLVGCQTITLDAENGKVFLAAVNHGSNPMVLVAVTNKNILMGEMLYYFKKLSDCLVNTEIKNIA